MNTLVQNMRVSVHAHPLKAVEPELFAPEDLLEARAGVGPSLLALEAPEASPGSGHTAHKWFSNWFGSNHEGPSENGNDSPLPQPPFVSLSLSLVSVLAGCLVGNMSCVERAGYMLHAVVASIALRLLVIWHHSLGGAPEERFVVQTLRVPTSITEQEEVQVEVTRLLVECYFDIVRANLQAGPLFSMFFCGEYCVRIP